MKDVKIMHETTSGWSVFVNFWERYFGKSINFKTEGLKDVFLYLSTWEAPKSTFLTVFTLESIHLFTSTSRVEERVGIVGNGCTLGLESYPSSLRPNLRLAGPGIHGQTGLARSHTGSDTSLQYALPDQGPEGAGSWSRMAHYLGRARLTSASPPHGPGKTLLVDEALPVGCHTETIVWTVLGHRLRRLCSVPQEDPHSPIRSLPH